MCANRFVHTVTEIHSRDEMIEYGCSIGRAFKANRRDRPWMVLMRGDFNSGKSLIALAIDHSLSPRRYLGEIGSHLDVDQQLMPHDLSSEYLLPPSKVVFGNFRSATYTSEKSLAEVLAGFSSSSPKAVVCIVSNLKRTEGDYWIDGFDYTKRGLRSDHFDMHVDIRLLPGEFSRRIALTYEDPNLAPMSAADAKAMLRKIQRSKRLADAIMSV